VLWRPRGTELDGVGRLPVEVGRHERAEQLTESESETLSGLLAVWGTALENSEPMEDVTHAKEQICAERR
jgi:hypothetical protein